MSHQAGGDWGAFWTAVNPAPGTGIPLIAVSSFTDSNAFLLWQNNNAKQAVGTVAHQGSIFLDYIKLIVTVPPQGTAMQAAISKDPTLSRYLSGGTQLTPHITDGPNGSTTSAQLIYAGNPNVNGLSSAGFLMGREVVRTVQPLVGDEYIFAFGPHSKSVGGQLTSGTNVQKMLQIFPQVVLAPQETLALHLWFPGAPGSSSSMSSGAPAFEVETGAWER